jgi:hypothetical protein
MKVSASISHEMSAEDIAEQRLLEQQFREAQDFEFMGPTRGGSRLVVLL